MGQVFETADPEVASEIFREQYTSMRMRIQGGRPLPLLRVAQTAVGRARLDQSTFRMALDGGADPVDRIFVMRVRSGFVRYTVNGSDETYGPGDTCFPLPLGEGWSVSLADLESELVGLDPALLDETGAAAGETGGSVRLLSRRPHSRTAAEQLWRMAETIGDSFAAQPEAESFSLVTASAARMLAAAVLTAFPNTAFPDAGLPVPTIKDRRDAHPETLRRAIAFIEADPVADVTVADIAAACRVTPRRAARLPPAPGHHAHGLSAAGPARLRAPGPGGRRLPYRHRDGGRRAVGVRDAEPVRRRLPRRLRPEPQ